MCLSSHTFQLAFKVQRFARQRDYVVLTVFAANSKPPKKIPRLEQLVTGKAKGVSFERISPKLMPLTMELSRRVIFSEVCEGTLLGSLGEGSCSIAEYGRVVHDESLPSSNDLNRLDPLVPQAFTLFDSSIVNGINFGEIY